MHAVMNNKVFLESKVQEVSKVEGIVNEIFEKYHINPEIFGNVLIALTECVNNAIRHGNKEDNSKKVVIDSFFNNSKLEISVLDEGVGFNPDILPDPTDPKYIEEPCGRGVFLIKSLSDEVKFENNGTLIKIMFNCN